MRGRITTEVTVLNDSSPPPAAEPFSQGSLNRTRLSFRPERKRSGEIPRNRNETKRIRAPQILARGGSLPYNRNGTTRARGGSLARGGSAPYNRNGTTRARGGSLARRGSLPCPRRLTAEPKNEKTSVCRGSLSLYNMFVCTYAHIFTPLAVPGCMTPVERIS